MHKRIFSLLSLLVPLGLASAACGGSSSETPPPLEPDPRGNNYLGNYHAPALEEADAGPSARPTRAVGTATEAPPPARAPARSTWGSGRSGPPR